MFLGNKNKDSIQIAFIYTQKAITNYLVRKS